MIRYLLTAASALALVSGVALAEPVEGTKTVTIQNSPSGKVVTKRYMNHRGQIFTKRKHMDEGRYGQMVIKRKHLHEGLYGSSVSRSKTVTDPAAGGSVTTHTSTER